MQKLLEEIKTSPGIIGSCVYANQKGVIASNLPAIFKNETQERVGNILHRIFKLNETIKLDVNALEIQYDEALILVKKLCKSSSLVIICEPDASTHLINMAVSVLAEDLQNLITDCEKTPLPSKTYPQSPQEVMNGTLSEELKTVKRCLAQHIGPVAGKILEKHLRVWLQNGAAVQSRLRELAQLLVTEIDDEPGQNEFLTNIKKVI
ncbi:MAG: hypothetical protein OQK97_11755 [Deltaproteobacteria bacterium]|jgi:predicted regulator of Ras-like GTPase activity (Roadblock/LC7/MglB family)|nr:hypothetical protein [Deltaproteobacteria bacterium]MCW8894003.1 hypothetical protein [Deltaproteobacteria bacterium]